MKRLILFLITMITACAVHAQVSTKNYILSRKMLSADSTAYVDKIAYYDGLGRPFETVVKSTQSGTVKERFATLQEYDSAGREGNTWLPIRAITDYLAPAAFKSYATGGTYGYSDANPYSEPVYEQAPVTKMLKRYGAGAAWRTADRSVQTARLVNTASGDLSCKLYTVTGTSLGGGTACYNAGSLLVAQTTDEDGNVSYTFTDKDDRTVLIRQMNGAEQLDTYFVYDIYSNLCFVLQPEYQTTVDLNLYAFQYRYDNRKRCVWKKLPGAEYIEYVYNDYDQLIFSQDGNQRTNGKWTFYVYDKFNRLTQQGENTTKAVSASGVYLQNYYDNYSYVGSTHFPSSGYNPEGAASYSKGQLTGTVMSVFGSNEKIATMYHYDIRGRLTKTIENNLMGGYNKTVTTYTFTDQPATVTITHTASGKDTLKEVYTYTYDHSDRISSVTHKLNNESTVTLASYTYDSFGRLSTKKLHGSSTNQLTYAYNIRNWVTGITNGKFTQNLTYNNGSTGFNGNITAMNWTANSASHAYTFSYDGVNRMTDAIHGDSAYTEKVTGYDKNGNIIGLQRYGNGLIDNLTYTYNGNQLTKVEDATGNAAGFNNGVSTNNEYTYDNNGNLTKDLNKGITNISYNSLNLPQVVTFSNGSTITYLYTADGRKLRTVHVLNGSAITTDYCGNVIYENGAQKLLLTEEGYVNLANSNTYYYYLKDHQGNNRVVINSSGTVAETNHYYPFGSTFASSNVQPYKYNGKELDTKNDLNWYDYGARHYDAILGRFTTQDRFAEKYSSLSPYQYAANSPVCNVDVNGDSLTIVGKMENLDAVVATFNMGLGGYYTTSVGNNGKVSISPVDGMSVNEMLSNQQAYYKLLDNIISGTDGMTTINVEKGSSVIIGDVNLSSIDIGDIQALGSGPDLNQESALLHETVEQYGIQVKGKSAVKAHLDASGAERLVTGSYIDPFNRLIENGCMLVPVLSSTGEKIKTIIVPIDRNGNVTGIKR